MKQYTEKVQHWIQADYLRTFRISR